MEDIPGLPRRDIPVSFLKSVMPGHLPPRSTRHRTVIGLSNRRLANEERSNIAAGFLLHAAMKRAGTPAPAMNASLASIASGGRAASPLSASMVSSLIPRAVSALTEGGGRTPTPSPFQQPTPLPLDQYLALRRPGTTPATMNSVLSTLNKTLIDRSQTPLVATASEDPFLANVACAAPGAAGLPPNERSRLLTSPDPWQSRSRGKRPVSERSGSKQSSRSKTAPSEHQVSSMFRFLHSVSGLEGGGLPSVTPLGTIEEIAERAAPKPLLREAITNYENTNWISQPPLGSCQYSSPGNQFEPTTRSHLGHGQLIHTVKAHDAAAHRAVASRIARHREHMEAFAEQNQSYSDARQRANVMRRANARKIVEGRNAKTERDESRRHGPPSYSVE